MIPIELATGDRQIDITDTDWNSKQTNKHRYLAVWLSGWRFGLVVGGLA